MKTVISTNMNSTIEVSDMQSSTHLEKFQKVTMRVFNSKKEQVGIDMVIPIEEIKRLAKGL